MKHRGVAINFNTYYFLYLIALKLILKKYILRSKFFFYLLPRLRKGPLKSFTFYFRTLLEIFERRLFFMVSLYFLYFCPRNFFFFQIYANYCKKSQNGEKKLTSCFGPGIILNLVLFSPKIGISGIYWLKEVTFNEITLIKCNYVSL